MKVLVMTEITKEEADDLPRLVQRKPGVYFHGSTIYFVHEREGDTNPYAWAMPVPFFTDNTEDWNEPELKGCGDVPPEILTEPEEKMEEMPFVRPGWIIPPHSEEVQYLHPRTVERLLAAAVHGCNENDS
jgi:hypothetical protein